MAKRKNKNRKMSNHCEKNAAMNILQQRFDIMDFDNTSPEYLTKLQTMIDSCIKNRVLNSKVQKLTEFDEHEYFKTKACYHKRRISAALTYIPYYAEKFKNKYPEAYVEKTMLSMLDYPSACLPDAMYNPDDKNIDSDDIIRAIALCMLDELFYCGNIHTAMLYIPQEIPENNNMTIFADFNDSLFDTAVIEGLMYLIANRDNEDDVFLNHTTVKRTKDNIAPITHMTADKADIELKESLDYDEYNKCIYEQAQKMTNRERLNKIMELLPEESICESQKQFLEELDRYMDVIFKITTNLNVGFKDAYARIIKLTEDINTVHQKLQKAVVQKNVNQPKQVTNTINAKLYGKKPMILANPDIIPPTNNRYRDMMNNPQLISELADVMNGYSMDVDRFYDKREQLIAEATELSKSICEKEEELSRFIAYTVNTHDDFDSKTMCNPDLYYDFEHFCVANPFEICFGYFCMLETGNDLPWLIEIASSILGFAIKQLPWTRYISTDIENAITKRNQQQDYDDEDMNVSLDNFIDGLIRDYRRNSDVIIRQTLNSDSKRTDCHEQETRMYATKYTDACEWYCNHLEKPDDVRYRNLNFAQILFNMTGMTFPRNFNYDTNIRKGLLESDVKRKNVDLLSFILTTCNQFPSKITLPVIIHTDIDSEIDDVNVLKRELSDKTDEISRLKKAVHEAEHKNRKLTESMDKLTEEAENEHQELMMLRELIFRTQNTENDTTDNNLDIRFPYEPNQNIVIFGGHATWLKAIEPLLTNVRIIDPYTNPDANIIRNADIVWLQPNAMPHSYYGKIINITRQRKIPVQYFAYASAEKCARQLAEHDIGVTNNEDNSD